MTITPQQLRCVPLVGMLLVGFSVQAHAKPLNWIDPQIPSALAPFADRVDALATLAEDNILIYQHPRQAPPPRLNAACDTIKMSALTAAP